MLHLTDHSLLHHNTFGIDVRCKHFYQYETDSELRQIVAELPTCQPSRLLHIGEGSNLLFLGDFDGVILRSAIRGMEEIDGDADSVLLLRVGAGEVWDDLVAHCVERGLYGLENLSLIPGQVGAAAVQNIGAYGAEVADAIHSVECISLATGQARTFSPHECCYGYRQSIFKNELRGQYAVTHVTLRLSRAFTPRLDYGGIRAALAARGIDAGQVTAQELRQTIIQIRRSRLPEPRELGNAGSFFMNPVVESDVYQRLLADWPQAPSYPVDENHVKIPAAWLIEQAGWKGRSLGPAAVHHRQALVLVNTGGASGQDILRLCRQVCQSVKEKFGIELHPEVNIL